MAQEDIIAAYLRRYNRAQIEAALDQALADLASGVTITNVSYEGGSTSGQITGDPQFLITVLNACLDSLDGKDVASQTAYFDYSTQRTGT